MNSETEVEPIDGSAIPALPESPAAKAAALPNVKATAVWIWIIAAGLVVAVVIAFWFAWSHVANPPSSGAGGKVAGSTGALQKGQGPADQSEQINTMIEHLAERLKGNPADVAGWSMLARTYSVVGRISDAVDAYAKAVALSKDDAGLLVDYADALGVKNNHSLAGEPIALIDRALKIAPKNVKALALAGTYAFDRQDYSAAVKYWDKVLEIGGADNMFAQRIQVQLENARQLTAPATDAKTAASSATVGAAVQSTKTANKSGAGSVGGVVTLLPSLLGTVKPDDAVFIFARLSQGSRMPLAILRKQVKDLPVAFTLNLDAASMPTLASNEKPVIEVLARISKSGNAVASKGDLSGQSAVVKVGAKDVSIEINQTINQ